MPEDDANSFGVLLAEMRRKDGEYRVEVYLKLNEIFQSEPDSSARLRQLHKIQEFFLAEFEADLIQTSCADLVYVSLRTLSYFLYHDSIVSHFSLDRLSQLLNQIIKTLYQSQDELTCKLCVWCLSMQNCAALGDDFVHRLVEAFVFAIEHRFTTPLIGLQAIKGLHKLLIKYPKKVSTSPTVNVWVLVLLNRICKSDNNDMKKEICLVLRELSYLVTSKVAEPLGDIPEKNIGELITLLHQFIDANNVINAIELWSILIVLFCTTFAQNSKYFNDLLFVPEVSMRDKDPSIRLFGLEHWNAIVNVFNSSMSDGNGTWLFSRQKVQLLMCPLLDFFRDEQVLNVQYAAIDCWDSIVADIVEVLNTHGISTLDLKKKSQWKKWFHVVFTDCLLADNTSKNSHIHNRIFDSLTNLFRRKNDHSASKIGSTNNRPSTNESDSTTMNSSIGLHHHGSSLNSSTDDSSLGVREKFLVSEKLKRKVVPMLIYNINIISSIITEVFELLMHLHSLPPDENQAFLCGIAIWKGLCSRIHVVLLSSCLDKPNKNIFGVIGLMTGFLFDDNEKKRIKWNVKVDLSLFWKLCFLQHLLEDLPGFIFQHNLLDLSEFCNSKFKIILEKEKKISLSSPCSGSVNSFLCEYEKFIPFTTMASYLLIFILLEYVIYINDGDLQKQQTNDEIKKKMILNLTLLNQLLKKENRRLCDAILQVLYAAGDDRVDLLNAVVIQMNDSKGGGDLKMKKRQLESDTSSSSSSSSHKKMKHQITPLVLEDVEEKEDDTQISFCSPAASYKKKEETASSTIFPDLVDCSQPISSIHGHFPPAFRRLFVFYKVHTIGDLSRMRIVDIKKFGLKDPITLVRKALTEYKGRKERIEKLSPSPFNNAMKSNRTLRNRKTQRALQLVQLEEQETKKKEAINTLCSSPTTPPLTSSTSSSSALNKKLDRVKFQLLTPDGKLKIRHPGDEDSQQPSTPSSSTEMSCREGNKMLLMSGKLVDHLDRSLLYVQRISDREMARQQCQSTHSLEVETEEKKILLKDLADAHDRIAKISDLLQQTATNLQSGCQMNLINHHC